MISKILLPVALGGPWIALTIYSVIDVTIHGGEAPVGIFLLLAILFTLVGIGLTNNNSCGRKSS